MRHPLSSRKSSVYIKFDVNFSHELPLTFTFLSYSEEREGKKEVKEGEEDRRGRGEGREEVGREGGREGRGRGDNDDGHRGHISP